MSPYSDEYFFQIILKFLKLSSKVSFFVMSVPNNKSKFSKYCFFIWSTFKSGFIFKHKYDEKNRLLNLAILYWFP